LVGRLYAGGDLEIYEAASLLDRTVPDAIALLEEGGYARAIDKIRLGAEDRHAILARVRADRERRAGRPAPSEERINRNVIASERIEGIDARAWLADG
jgi:hypothetical protein